MSLWPSLRGRASRVVPAIEIVVSLALATAVVAALQNAAPPAGLSAIYLLAVVAVAIRRGEWAALVTAALGTVALNYLLVAPRETLAIAHTQDLVELVVSLIVALAVGRLAGTERLRAREAHARAVEAGAREEEARMVAALASAILSRRDLPAQLTSVERLLARGTRASSVRVVVEPDAQPVAGEYAVRLRADPTTWLYMGADSSWDHQQLERLAEPLGRLVDVARERGRAAEQAAEVEAARRTETARTAVLHAISHDLRSPLTAITTAAYALHGGRVTDAERRELIETIDSESRRLSRLVDDLLDLSMIEAGAASPRSDWCDLHDVVTSAAAHLHGSERIRFELPDALPLIRADATQLERVFSNLLDNAIKFSPPGTPVRVRGAVAGGHVTIRIVDEGPGVARGERAHVFEPFFRGGTNASPGSGLGLAICRGFVEANGGRIVLQSHNARGASFAVSFPCVEQPLAQPVPG